MENPLQKQEIPQQITNKPKAKISINLIIILILLITNLFFLLNFIKLQSNNYTKTSDTEQTAITPEPAEKVVDTQKTELPIQAKYSQVFYPIRKKDYLYKPKKSGFYTISTGGMIKETKEKGALISIEVIIENNAEYEIITANRNHFLLLDKNNQSKKLILHQDEINLPNEDTFIYSQGEIQGYVSFELTEDEKFADCIYTLIFQPPEIELPRLEFEINCTLPRT